MRSAIGWWLIGAVILGGFLTLLVGVGLLFGPREATVGLLFVGMAAAVGVVAHEVVGMFR